MCESVNANFDDMGGGGGGGHVECRACDLHDFFNVALQTVDVRKARKIVMKSEIV